MNNKLVLIFLGLLSTALIKLSVDVYYTHPATVQKLNLSLDHQSQRLGMLNDQLIVLQRQVKESESNQSSHPKLANSHLISDESALNYKKEDYIRDYLELIHINIQQKKMDMAFENIQQLQQKIKVQPLLSEAFNQALLDALEQDKYHLQQYIKQRAAHLVVLQQQMNTLEKLLQVKPLDQQNEKWDFSSWLTIGKAEDILDLENRYLNYRYIQLKLILAEQSLLSGEIELYRQQISEMKSQIVLYPDLESKKILQQLKKIDSLVLPASPQLSAITLLSEA